MLKIEYIWRELLYRAIEEQRADFKMSDLALKFHLSTSLVSHALSPLRDLQIVKIGKIRSRVVDTERLLLFWATRRNLKKDIVHKIYSGLSVLERETSMSASVYPTAYSAYRIYYRDVPSDYENIYFYAKDIDEIQKRFPENLRKDPNLFILKPDPYLTIYKKTPQAQIFVDLWNLPEWYAKEFSEALLAKIKKRIGI